MKKNLLTLFFIFNIFFSFSQIWVKANAVWHYDFSTQSSSGFIKIEYIKDTILASKLSKMFLTTKYEFVFDQNNISHFLGSSILDTNYTWNNNDTIFYWKNNQFEVLYDFSRSVGEIWEIGSGGNLESNCSSISTVEVIDQNIINYNGVSYKSLNLYSADSSNYKLRGKYNSRFGAYTDTQSSYSLIFPTQSWFCDPLIPDESTQYIFKCFEDDSLIYNPSGVDCEYLLTHLEINDINKNPIHKIYPNPSSGELTIISNEEKCQIKIYNMQGIVCLYKELNSFINKIELDLNEGNYIIEITNNNKEKVIKSITIK